MTDDRSPGVSASHHAFGDRAAAEREHGFARRHVPFFRDRDDDERGDAFEMLPFSTKVEYRRNFPFGILADGRRPNDPHVQRLDSSGTEGDRLSTVVHAHLLAERMFACLGFNSRAATLLTLPRIRTARYAAPNCSAVECANPRATMADRTLPDGTLVLPVHHDLLTTPDDMVRTAIEEIDRYRPDMLYADPTHLAFLARGAQRLGLANPVPPETTILLSFSYAARVARRQIAAWTDHANPVALALAMSEFGYLGLSCAHGTLHLDDRNYYLEFLPAGEGVSGTPLFELAVTSLGDRLCPHIRYLTGDLYRLGPTCGCGAPAPAVEAAGRRKDCLIRDDRLFTPRDLDDIVGDAPWIDLFQLDASAPGLVFRYVGDLAQTTEGGVDRLGTALAAALGAPVAMERAGYLPAARGGKFAIIRPAPTERGR